MTPKQACNHYGVCCKTLRRWDKDGKINTIRTKGGHRRYVIQTLSNPENNIKQSVMYCRVSTRNQKHDLERQMEFLSDYMDSKSISNYIIIKDIGSGINFTWSLAFTQSSNR